MFFRLSSLELGLLIFGIVLGSTLLGAFAGRRLREHSETLREPFGVLQAALLGLVALILAFGLTMAVGRYEQRRAAVVEDANTIGTTYLRAQTLREPMRTESLDNLTRLHRCRDRLLEFRARERRGAGRDGGGGAPPADALGPRRRRARRISDRQCAAALRRDPERDDRLGDRPDRDAPQPRAIGGAPDRDRREPRSASACWPSTWRSSRGASSRSSSRPRSCRCCCSSRSTSTARRGASSPCLTRRS